MAVVQEMTTNGATVRIHDDFYRDIDDKTINRILERIAARAMIDLNTSFQGAVTHKSTDSSQLTSATGDAPLLEPAGDRF